MLPESLFRHPFGIGHLGDHDQCVVDAKNIRAQLAEIGNNTKLTDEEFAVFEQVREKAPSQPVDFVGTANSLGVPEAVIGLTLVAVGTSLPEFAVSLLAAMRCQADVAVGNILGSNIFNLLGILGLSALLQPLPVAQRILQFDHWVMLASALILMLFLYTGMRLSRLEGALLVLGYVAYVVLSFSYF